MRRIGILLSCCLVALLALPVLADAFGDEVVVGLMVPLTKKGASYGVQSRAATEVAVEEINAKGGVGGRKLVMIFRPQGILGRDTLNWRRWFSARPAAAG